MTSYVVGFAFNETRERVLLIRKERPTWQAGLFNGVGGHIERGETVTEAAAREFEEEVGIATGPEDWRFTGVMQFPHTGACVYVLTATLSNLAGFRQMTDELPRIWDVQEALIRSSRLIPNLRWLIPLCLDDEANSFNVTGPIAGAINRRG